jgi:hypothetical protein
MDDEQLTEGFDRLVRLSRPSTPSIGEIEGRVARRRTRRRRRQQAAIGACAVLLVAAGVVVAARSSGPAPDQQIDMAGSPTTTAVGTAPGDPVFTVARLPENLSFDRCEAGPTGPEDESLALTCSFDDPATGVPDGLGITRIVEGATPEIRDAWATGDAEAAAVASGGSDDPTAASFRTVGGTEVLDLAPAGRPSDDARAAVQVIIGDDLVDLRTTGVSMTDVGRIVTGLSMEPPEPEVAAALGVLPEGSTALVQGERPLWVQPDAIDPSTRSRFPGTTVGAELSVPGVASTVGIDITTGIDADALIDDLLASDTPGLTETEIAGHRAVELDPGAQMPPTLPNPRPGPQVLVATDDATIVRVIDRAGSADRVRAVAEALG